MTTMRFEVDGMTCEHCVRSVREEVGAIDGVDDVQVDLASGAVELSSSQEVPMEAVRAAVEDAGYTVR